MATAVLSVLAASACAVVAGRLVGEAKIAAARSNEPQAVSAIVQPVPSEPCIAGPARVLARGARLAAGVETGEIDGRIAVAVSTSALEARAVEIDGTTLGVRATTRLVTTHPVKRALPLLSPDGVVDVEEDDGASFPAADGILRLREPRADAVRGAWLVDGVYAAVFRRDGSIWALTTSRSGVIDGPVALSQATGGAGAPALATTRAGDVIATWAERASAGEPWRVRWTRWTPGMEPETPRTWASPGMAPSVAARPGGGVVLAWTEGTSGAHAVRARVIGDDGIPRGNAMDVSVPGANAGQERIVLSSDGRGAVFFLEGQPDGRFALVARTLSCATD